MYMRLCRSGFSREYPVHYREQFAAKAAPTKDISSAPLRLKHLYNPVPDLPCLVSLDIQRDLVDEALT